jgi:hypothetical protein
LVRRSGDEGVRRQGEPASGQRPAEEQARSLKYPSHTRAIWLITALTRRARRRDNASKLHPTDVVATRLRIESGAIAARFGRAGRLKEPIGGVLGFSSKIFSLPDFATQRFAKCDFARSHLSPAIDRVRAPKISCIHEIPILIGFLSHLTRCCLDFSCIERDDDSSSCAHRVEHAEQLRSPNASTLP